MGVIEPVGTEWAAPIVFTLKKEGSLLFFVDSRKLTAVAVPDSYLILTHTENG